MVRSLGMVMVVMAAWLVATPARAQSLGEVTAATGVAGTLAKSGTMNAAGTIGTVKNALGKAVATKQGQLDGASTQMAWGGKGSAWATRGGGAGWATKGAGAGWATKGAGAGWMVASASGAGWASGGWGGRR